MVYFIETIKNDRKGTQSRSFNVKKKSFLETPSEKTDFEEHETKFDKE